MRYRRMSGGETCASGVNSGKPCIWSTSRPFHFGGTSIWYTAPPSRPKSARAPGKARKAGSPSVAPSGSGRTWTGGGNGPFLGLVVAGAALLSPVHADATVNVTISPVHAHRLTELIAGYVPSTFAPPAIH